MNKNILGLAIVAALTTGTVNAANIAVVDDFNTGADSIAADGTNTIAASVVGGFRMIDITKAGILGATAAVLTPPGLFSHSADALTSATSVVTWDANGAGLGGLDWLTGYTDNAFSLDILSIDQGQIDLTLSVFDLVGNIDAVTLSNLGAGIQSFEFSSFSGVDFTSIDGLSLTVAGGSASDLTLDALGISGNVVLPPVNDVPEPTSAVLLAMGLLAFGVSFRKA